MAFTRLMQIHTWCQCWVWATQQQSQGTPRPDASLWVSSGLCVEAASQGAVRVSPEFIRPEQTSIWLCEGRALEPHNSVSPRICLDLLESLLKNSALQDQGGHSQLTILQSASSAGQSLKKLGRWSEWFSYVGSSGFLHRGIRALQLWLMVGARWHLTLLSGAVGRCCCSGWQGSRHLCFHAWQEKGKWPLLQNHPTLSLTSPEFTFRAL